jgi:antibiotic biosynthesis monooxygenase (ABM) superfamily enzyme
MPKTPKPTSTSKSKTPAQVRDIQTRIKPRKLTKFEELLIKYKGDITKIPGWQGGRGTE